LVQDILSEKRMVRIIVRKNESPERAMKRFKRKVEREGLMRDIKKNRYYRKPSVRKKEKIKAAAKRRRKTEKRKIRR
jgi:small subunit ribosomal protein S21